MSKQNTEAVSQEHIEKARALLVEYPNYVVSVTWCKDCVYTHKVWADLGVADQIHTVEFDKLEDQEEANKLLYAFMEIAGEKNFPTIFLGGKLYGKEDRLKASEEAGTLRKELGDFGLKFD